jgi:hypothetical protein
MSKPRPSLESIAGTVAPRPDNVIPGPNPATKPEPVRKDKPHVSLYLDKRVQKVIKEIALAYDRSQRDDVFTLKRGDVTTFRPPRRP